MMLILKIRHLKQDPLSDIGHIGDFYFRVLEGHLSISNQTYLK